MDIFNQIYEGADYIFSFFYRFMICDYKDFVDFFKGDYIFNITSLVNSIDYTVSLPNLSDIPILGGILDIFIDVVGFLFKPLPFLEDSIGFLYTPFYNCLISFFINTLIIIAFVKLVLYLIK